MHYVNPSTTTAIAGSISLVLILTLFAILLAVFAPSEVEAISSEEIRLERILERQARALEQIAKHTGKCGCQ